MAKMQTTSGKTVEVLMENLRGKKVKTLAPLRNGVGVIPKGAICIVAGTWRSGVSLDSPKCDHCGVSIYISKVHRSNVMIVDD